MRLMLKTVAIILLGFTSVALTVASSLTVFPWACGHVLAFVLSWAYAIFIGDRGSAALDVLAGVSLSAVSALAILLQIRMLSGTQLSPALFLFSVLSTSLSASFLIWRASKRKF